MGCLLRRHRLEHLKHQEAEDAVAEALLEAKLKEAENSAPPKKQPKKNEG